MPERGGVGWVGARRPRPTPPLGRLQRRLDADPHPSPATHTPPTPCSLYSSAHYNDTFPQHTPPEILNTPLEGVALALKALGVARVANFPFPTPPEADALRAAERCLVALSGEGWGTGACLGFNVKGFGSVACLVALSGERGKGRGCV